MIVAKFGGTSVGSAARIKSVAGLVVGGFRPMVVVVSAMGGTTDRLLEAGDHATAGNLEAAMVEVARIRERHLEAAGARPVANVLEGLFSELEDLLRGIALLRETTARTRALLVSFGERLSAPLVADALVQMGQASVPVDARDLICTDSCHQEAMVDMEASATRVQEALVPILRRDEVPVVTGFIGADGQGITTTLGRGGSDYTAALLGAFLDANEVWIWTDVDGILTADPRLVSEARSLRRVSYREAAEMSYFGARVLHPRTMGPCAKRRIPIRIRSTFEPDSPGTVVAEESESVPEGVKTVTTAHGLALVTVEGRGMAGLPGIARRIFEATEASGANVVMISQASSEQSVSLVVREQDVRSLVQRMNQRFRLELADGAIEGIDVREKVAILSIIGEGMAGTPGISARLFGSLGAQGVNVLAIAQGASERSISVAVEEEDARRAVRGVHTSFGLTRVLHVMLWGCGAVGQTLLTQLTQTRVRLAKQEVELRIVGVVNRSSWVFVPQGLPPDEVEDALRFGLERPSDLEILEQVKAERLTDVVLVDLTAADTGGVHHAALRSGFHVVSANKVPLAGEQAGYDALVQARDASRVTFGYETTFGAGLPVLHTLKELVHTGDVLLSVSGCFSGTLGFLCTELQAGVELGAAIDKAGALGFTEPDPREDLSGRDVARKALIIARAMGRKMDPSEIDLQPMVPGLEIGLDKAVDAYSPILAAEFAKLRAQGKTLRYVAEISESGVRVGPKAVPIQGPIGSLSGPDNILVFRTRRYNDNPLVIRGPGAGSEVTAAGVLGDLLRIALRQ